MGSQPAARIDYRATCLSGGREMGARMRAFEWSATPLGAVDTWSQSLRIAVDIVLNSPYPTFVWWGPHLINLYNDSSIPILGARHPAALGRPAAHVWADMWNVVGPRAETVLRDGRATWNEEVLLLMERNDFTEETYATWSYSPVADDDGSINGVFCAVREDTPAVLSRRRLKTVRDLGERALAGSRGVPQACRTAAETLAESTKDVPFFFLYLLDANGAVATLREAGGAGVHIGAAPERVPLGSASDIWGFSRVLRTRRPATLDNLEEILGRVPAGTWADAWTRRAVVAPLATSRAENLPAGFLVAGISPRLPFDDEYRGFVELVASHLAATISIARARQGTLGHGGAALVAIEASEAQRQRISRELHDELGQQLTALVLGLRNARDAMTEDTPLHGTLQHLQAMAARVSRDLHRIALELRPGALDDKGLQTALSDYVEEWSGRHDIGADVQHVGLGAGRLPSHVENTVYRIVQEALTNVAKHAGATRVSVVLQQRADLVVAIVEDNGCGFDSASPVEHGALEGRLGLLGMKERAALVGGVCEVESQAGGTTVLARIPVSLDEAPHA